MNQLDGDVLPGASASGGGAVFTAYIGTLSAQVGVAVPLVTRSHRQNLSSSPAGHALQRIHNCTFTGNSASQLSKLRAKRSAAI